jgi:hypothetical protein
MRDRSLDEENNAIFRHKIDESDISWILGTNATERNEMVNLAQAMTQMATSATALAKETERFDETAFLDLYRNGISVAVKALNDTSTTYSYHL